MPGILPMKVIKVGTSSQSRIAQACDRCRSKKIRCDGIRPCCSQCANVGFECKTSDKLSRRAFPRGYTESLEERVRILEGEVRELKDLLDEKDEKIDMLSKMHSHRRMSHSSSASAPVVEIREPSPPPKEDTFRVQASPLLLETENSDSYFMGASSGRAFVDAFKRKVQESGKSCTEFKPDAFLNVQSQGCVQLPKPTSGATIPPRMFSDRCVNVFFQEWAPLFPVIHRPSFLHLYEDYLANPEAITNDHKLAQLHLVFSIAGISSDIPDKQNVALCERQWRTSLKSILMDNTIATLQVLILASLYCISKGDYKRLQLYKGVAVSLSHRLGLHQSQKRFSFGALTIETRKKTFWTLYTMDCFSAAMLGLPKLLREGDIHCEYPTDIDDEYVTEKGFLPTLPGESSKISSALALFRASRILSKVLEQNYPAATSHELSLQSLSILEAEIQTWSDQLPQHLKLTFIQDKPSTNITGSRSALLSLAYYYIRSLIHRPAVGSTLGSKASSSVIALAESSKHVIQIVQLLEERTMSFSFCINKSETLTLCGLSLLYQNLELKQGSCLMKDGHRLVADVINYLEKFKAPGAADFRKLAASMMPIESPEPQASDLSTPSEFSAPSPSMSRREARLQAARYVTSGSDTLQKQQQERLRRATMSSLPNNGLGRHSNNSQSSLESSNAEHALSRRNHRQSAGQLPATSTRQHVSAENMPKSKPNLDYLSLSSTPAVSQSHSPSMSRTSKSSSHHAEDRNRHTPLFSTSNMSASEKASSVSAAEWERLLSSLDNGQANIYDAVYGGPSLALNSLNNNTAAQEQANTNSTFKEWSPESWDMSVLSMQDFELQDGMGGMNGTTAAQSVLSFSEESLSSGDDIATSEYLLASASDGIYGSSVVVPQSGTSSGSGSLLAVDYRQQVIGSSLLADGYPAYDNIERARW